MHAADAAMDALRSTAWQAGRNARSEGRSVDACPFYDGGDARVLRRDWRAGYYERDREIAREAVR